MSDLSNLCSPPVSIFLITLCVYIYCVFPFDSHWVVCVSPAITPDVVSGFLFSFSRSGFLCLSQCPIAIFSLFVNTHLISVCLYFGPLSPHSKPSSLAYMTVKIIIFICSLNLRLYKFWIGKSLLLLASVHLLLVQRTVCSDKSLLIK